MLLPISSNDLHFPVRRVFCVGRNYEEHSREMGHEPDRELPFFFTKPAGAMIPCTADQESTAMADSRGGRNT